MLSRSAELLRDLIQNLHYLPPWQLHLIEPALTRLVREVQLDADEHRRHNDPARFDAALESLYQMRDALWARDATQAVKTGTEALRLLG